MAPFPETEIMTLKRLEVALKKNDYKLLRDGAYKLHEKYHGGFKFEYIDLLKDILYNLNNSNAPSEIKDILIPTIEDILSDSEPNNFTSPYENQENRVSTLTSLEYKNSDETTQTTRQNNNISAFDVFASKPTIPYTHTNNDVIINHQKEESVENIQFQTVNPTTIDEPMEEKETNVISNVQNYTNTTVVNKTKTISILYIQNNSQEKNKNIKKYTEMVSHLENERIDFSELIKLISEINTQSNTNISELASILEQIQNRSIKINLITNSTNSNIVGLNEKLKIPYEINSIKEKINILPLFGLTNMYKCSQCKEEHIDLNDNITPYVIQCPKCKNSMLPNFSCIDTKINLDYYNNAITNLANSEIWLILYPSFAESMILEMMKIALSLSKDEKTVFICDKDINSKETYKSELLKINQSAKINIDISALESFLKIV